MRYWKRTERQNAMIGLVVCGFLIANMLLYQNILATIGTLGAGIFVFAHWYYAKRMKQLLSENTMPPSRENIS
ncbi:hypothetical protein [Acidithiobacillus ferrooxidans]|uniref:hypothetical protein n=1 Tax=Acidithiobacillus ferrooxidans TaxID=920 RepID=UPI0013D7548D|nr:hypothetical protein [Acidithiobacillus ferrooxidans]